MTWQPRIIEGGATPPAEPPLTWWHVHLDASEHVVAQWPGDAPGRHCRALFVVSDAGPTFVSGIRPDETTLRELAEDVERWHSAQSDDVGHLESARWGARYHA